MHRVDVQLEDDLTGGPADETIQFSLDGRSYEIDLNSRHAAEFRDRLEPFTDHARLARPRQRVTVRSAASRERSRQIRLWAEQRGFALSPHGRLPGNVIEEYELEHGADHAGEPPARRLAGQRGGSARQGRKASTGGRATRQRTARGALRSRAARRARHPRSGGPAGRPVARRPAPSGSGLRSPSAQLPGPQVQCRERDLWQGARVIVPIAVPPVAPGVP